MRGKRLSSISSQSPGKKRARFTTAAGTSVVTTVNGAFSVTLNDPLMRELQNHTLVDLDGGKLQDGDTVRIKVSDETSYWAARPDHTLIGNAQVPGGLWQKFTIHLSPIAIHSGDKINLKSHHDKWVVAEDGGAQNVRLKADRTAAQAWETFRLDFVTVAGKKRARFTTAAGTRVITSVNGPFSSVLDGGQLLDTLQNHTIVDLDGGALLHGDRVLVWDSNEKLYWSAQQTGLLESNRQSADEWETFTIHSPKIRNHELAKKFAPILRFDGAAASYGYPMDAEKYFQECVEKPCSKLQNTDLATVRAGKVPTYFQVATNDSGQLRIMYWFFYGHQEPCNTTGISDSGEHPGDWERIMVTTTQNQQDIAAVTFWQHGGSYTRIAGPRDTVVCDIIGSVLGRCFGNDGFERQGLHPIVYVGKIAHGSYHSRKTFSSDIDGHKCGYFADYRNPGSDDYMETERYLVSTDEDLPFLNALRQRPNDPKGFYWAYPGSNKDPVSTNILRDTNLPRFDMPACEGDMVQNFETDNGCFMSECLSGDDQLSQACSKECPTGYTNYGFDCGKNDNVFDRVQKQKYGYDYLIPSIDAGLARRRQMSNPAEAGLPHSSL